ncbi:MAG: transposase [Bacteroidia bacterium]
MCSKSTFVQKYSLAQDVYLPHFEGYRYDIERKLFLESKHYRAVNMSLYCRTESLGRVVFGCKSCGSRHEMWRSCKHRWCATCGIVETYRWGESLRGRLLNLAHSHITFTLPKGLRFLSKCCESVFYDCMFQAVNGVLQSWFKAKHGVKCGVVMVLHTAGSDLKYHPHIHCIVSCGGIGEDGASGEKALKSLNTNYLCSHQHLGNQFRIRLSKILRERCAAGKMAGEGGEILTLSKLNSRLSLLSQKSWIVGVEKGLWDVGQVVGYVGRYTKRACISEYKISAISNFEISFTYNDYANTPRGEKPFLATKRQGMTSFLDDLLQHVPDKGFHLVRYCGIYANASRKNLPSRFFFSQNIENEDINADLSASSSEVEQYKRYRKNQKKVSGKDPFECSCGQELSFLYSYIGGKRIFGKVVSDSS